MVSIKVKCSQLANSANTKLLIVVNIYLQQAVAEKIKK